MVLGVQVLGIIFALFLMYFTFLNYKRKEMGAAELTFWSALWLLFVYVILFPYSLSAIADSLHLVRLMDLFTILAFMFLIALTFYNYMMTMHTKKKMEQIVRAIALRKK
ncbi:MAG TPA: DUF2304 domain-containing protein [Candidatus Nanoarchaeia archaeon]|nr:DUF2304 domain-containing protein [Candidatus Nanoarchaeia archaeon]